MHLYSPLHIGIPHIICDTVNPNRQRQRGLRAISMSRNGAGRLRSARRKPRSGCRLVHGGCCTRGAKRGLLPLRLRLTQYATIRRCECVKKLSMMMCTTLFLGAEWGRREKKVMMCSVMWRRRLPCRNMTHGYFLVQFFLLLLALLQVIVLARLLSDGVRLQVVVICRCWG